MFGIFSFRSRRDPPRLFKRRRFLAAPSPLGGIWFYLIPSRLFLLVFVIFFIVLVLLVRQEEEKKTNQKHKKKKK